MNFKTAKGIQEARKVADAIKKSALLRKLGATELKCVAAMVKVWESSLALKTLSLPVLEEYLDLAGAWNASPLLRNLSLNELKGRLKIERERKSDPLLKTKSRQQVEAALRSVRAWEKSAKRNTTAPSAIKASLEIAGQWEESEERRKLGPAGMDENRRIVSELEKLGLNGEKEIAELKKALKVLRAWSTTPALRGKTVKDLRTADQRMAEWERQPALRGKSPEILGNEVIRAMGIINRMGEEGPYYYLPDDELCKIVHTVMAGPRVMSSCGEAAYLTDTERREYGGWIVESAPGGYDVPELIAGSETSVYLGTRPKNAIAKFHTHVGSSVFSTEDEISIENENGYIAFSMLIYPGFGEVYFLNPQAKDFSCDVVVKQKKPSGYGF